MTGMHTLEAGHDLLRRPQLLANDGRLRRFLEQRDFYTMHSRDDLAAGSTKWVLANPRKSYIAYTYEYSGPMGVKDLVLALFPLVSAENFVGADRS